MKPTNNIPDALITDVRNYYEKKLEQFGSTSRGVDWKDAASQLLRFEQLAKLFEGVHEASFLDFGCGYGAMYDFIAASMPGLAYYGYDISPEMLLAARLAHPAYREDRWLKQLPDGARFDFVIASGIFNVRLEHDCSEWVRYIMHTLDTFNRIAIKGFAFNMLTSYSDPEKRAPHLFFADPCEYFNLCKTRYAQHVTLIHDYPLYEFTLLVRKTSL
jgi:SAM-dependent methyltransferase